MKKMYRKITSREIKRPDKRDIIFPETGKIILIKEKIYKAKGGLKKEIFLGKFEVVDFTEKLIICKYINEKGCSYCTSFIKKEFEYGILSLEQEFIEEKYINL